MKNVVKFLVGVVMASFMAYGVVKYLGAPSENEFLLVFVVTLIVFSSWPSSRCRWSICSSVRWRR